MISFIIGKPGDGKTLFAVRDLLETLISTEKFVVTNIPLQLPAVCEYVAKRRKEPFVLDERLKVIPDEEVYEFYRHRSGDLVLPWSPDKNSLDEKKRLPRPEFIERMKGDFALIRGTPEAQKPCAYYIDEAHNFFSARDWATNGRGLLYYASQHRHLHDEIFLITQVMENVEKQLRGLVSETHAVRNQLRRRIGPIRMRPVFRVKSYYGVPQGPTMKPFSETTFELDLKGVASCYNTVGALGIHTKPEEKKNRGVLPWWVLPVGGVLAVLGIVGAFVGLPMLGAAGAKQAIGAVSPAKPATEEKAKERPVLKGAAPVVLPAREKPVTTKETGNPVFPETTLHVRGYVVGRGRVNVVLSDGTVITEAQTELERVDRNGIVLSGRRLPFLTPKPQARTAVVEKRIQEKPEEKTGGLGVDPQIGADAP